MSLLMEALRKAEQGKSAESDAIEEIVALVSVDDEQSAALEDELLSLDLSDEPDEALHPETVDSHEQEPEGTAMPVFSSEELPAGEEANAPQAFAAHESNGAETESDMVRPKKAVSPLPRKPDVVEAQPPLEAAEPTAGGEDTGAEEMAEILFQAKRGSRKELRLVAVLLVMVLLCAAVLGGWYFLILEGEEGQFPSADPVVAASFTAEAEPALAAVQRPVPENEALMPADVAQTATRVAQPSMEEAGLQDTQIEVVKTAETVPARVLVKKQEPAEAPVKAFNQQLANTPPSAATTPATPVSQSKPAGSAQAAYQSAMDQQAQTRGRAPIEIRHSRKRVSRSLPLHEAWKAFNEHRYQDAGVLYTKILDREPFNRDALLGHAAVAMRQGQTEQALDTYMKLLERDPRDPLALAGLISLRGQQQPSQSLARLQQLIDANPDVAGLHFVLGNLYAGQSRWAYAQQAYFKAYSGEPEHPEYLFNLAVSLDHLGKKTQSLQFYRMAVDRAKQQPVKFSVKAVIARIDALEAGA